MRTPAIEMPASRSACRTTSAPAAVVPVRAMPAPSSFSSISETKLSLSRFIPRTIADRGSERSIASGNAPAGAAPARAVPVTAMPRRASAALNARAAAAAEPFAPFAALLLDRERRERRRLDPEKPWLPAGRRAARVEVSLVADDASRNAADPQAATSRASASRSAGGERRIAVTDEKEVATPDPASELSLAENVRAKAIPRAQEPERGERHCELLRRSGRECRGPRSP